jgi:hypothetical protein
MIVLNSKRNPPHRCDAQSNEKPMSALPPTSTRVRRSIEDDAFMAGFGRAHAALRMAWRIVRSSPTE